MSLVKYWSSRLCLFKEERGSLAFMYKLFFWNSGGDAEYLVVKCIMFSEEVLSGFSVYEKAIIKNRLYLGSL